MRAHPGSQKLVAAKPKLRTAMERHGAGPSPVEASRAVPIAQELERARIARELHDRVGQNLTALLLGLKALERELPAGAPQIPAIHSLLAITEKAGSELHDIALRLRPAALDDLGLVRALATFLDDWATRAGIEIGFDHARLGASRLPHHLETILYRVLCEAIWNVAKHARARTVSVILQRMPAQVTGIVEDDGIGFDTTAPASSVRLEGLGLAAMRDCVALVDGTLMIESAPGRGTTLIVRLPTTDAGSGT